MTNGLPLTKPFSLLIFILLIAEPIVSQCSNFEINYPSGLFSSSSDSWQNVTNCAYGGDFQEYYVVQGGAYEWTSCYGVGFDSEITLWDEAHENILSHEDENCASLHGTINWSADYTGIVHLLISEQGCSSNTDCHSLYHRQVSPPPPPVNNDPCNPINLSINSVCSYETYSNSGATDSGMQGASCGAYNGKDIWFSFMVPSSGNVSIRTLEGSITDAVLAVYTGSCNSLVEIDCNDDSNNLMPALDLDGLNPGEIVFIRVFAYAGTEVGDFDLCAFEPCSIVPDNNDICNAEYLIVGSTKFGDTGCSTGIGDPSRPSCWTDGEINSVWYKFNAPLSGEIMIETDLTSIVSTQVALYFGSCLDPVLLACNRNAGMGCGTTGSSSLAYSSLIPGNAYYIRIDGEGNNVGQFFISLSDLAELSPQTGSDCSAPIDICGLNLSVADPGPQGTGNICDYDDSSTCTQGEMNSAWYQINVGASGNFLFNLIPNNGSPTSCGTESDYDFVLWKIAGSGPTTDCDAISNDASIGLLSCNYSSRGVTGISNNGDSPAGFSNCFNESFESAVAVNQGDILLLAVQNYSGSSRGFSIDFSSSDEGVCPTNSPSVLIWSGGLSESWDNSLNWGDCSVIPNCSRSAIIPPTSGNFPVLMGIHEAHDLYIEEGAKLVIPSGSELHLHGNLTNLGTIEMAKDASIFMDDTLGTQQLLGNLVGENAIGNLIITKESGVVNLQTTIEIKGDLRTTNSTSRFNSQGNTIYLGGDFNNAAGSTTFRGVGSTGRLIFNGTGEQNYDQGSSRLNLNEVIVNNSGPGVNLISDIRIKNNTGKLTLVNGVIKTNSWRVFIRNQSAEALNEGNLNSYVEGILVKHVSGTGLYHFPVGDYSSGYQRADVYLRSHSFNFLTVTHSPWNANPGPLLLSDEQVTFDLNALDNGYFTITANRNPTTADYDIHLFNQTYGNSDGASHWAVMKDSGSGWTLNGESISSAVDTVSRYGLTGFSRFATAQASNPLPVELLSFSGSAQTEGNLLEWVTASEVNNDYFTLEGSIDAVNFQVITEMPGAGFSSSMLSYEILDRYPSAAVNYYRLKQTDYDGSFTYSDIIVVEREEAIENQSIWPNPVVDNLQIDVGQISGQIGEVVIFDVVGNIVLNVNSWSTDKDSVLLITDTRELSRGVYFVSIHNNVGQRVYKERFIKR
ncbi:MAG: T9SS type A sorting domain-containing protein [Flavobacteriales bacterium]|nr:T9SS type A sorting domain-containing protein [Flavobacteriales bacterium]